MRSPALSSPTILFALLAGSAGLLGCLDEHPAGTTEVMAGECQACHLAEAAEVVEPVHVGVYPQTCIECHGVAGWSPSTFSHDFVLSTCYDCHRPEYDNSTDPPHMTFGYPTTCQDCHDTPQWAPALGGAHNETGFPVTTGPHKEFACLECHENARGPAIAGRNTDCVGCHTGDHSASKMSDKHKEVPDYVFNEAAPNFCLECHPTGIY